MNTYDENYVSINKSIVNKMLYYLGDYSLNNFKNENDTYLIEKNELEKLKTKFFRLINNALIASVSHIKEANLSKLQELYEKHKTMYYENVRNRFNHLDVKLYTDEELINSALVILKEVSDIKEIPKLIESITNKLDEVKIYNLVYSSSALSLKFKELKKKGSKLKEYKNLDDNLSNIILKTYEHNITNPSDINMSDSLSIIASDENENVHLLTNDNIEDFSYGYIYSQSDILTASNDKNTNKLLSFDHIDKKENYFSVIGNPIAVYYISVGNKTLCNNYKKAQKLKYKHRNLSFIEIDASKYLSFEKLDKYKQNFIDELIENKGIPNSSPKDDKYYDRFNYFFNEYLSLKGSKYNESNIINLFDFCFNLIYSQKYQNLDLLLTNRFSTNEIYEALMQNIYHEENIFRYDNVDILMINRFVSKYAKYANNEVLNRVYPGINVILEVLSNSNEDELNRIVDIINSSSKKDSWLISQLIRPTHIITKTENIKTDNNNSIISEYVLTDYSTLKEFLQSMDEDKKVKVR